MIGLIDKGRIWNVVRAGYQTVDSLRDCEISNNLMAYYRMSYGSGTILTDDSGHGSAGRFSWIFKGVDNEGKALANGVYLCVMIAGKQSFINKVVLVK